MATRRSFRRGARAKRYGAWTGNFFDLWTPGATTVSDAANDVIDLWSPIDYEQFNVSSFARARRVVGSFGVISTAAAWTYMDWYVAVFEENTAMAIAEWSPSDASELERKVLGWGRVSLPYVYASTTMPTMTVSVDLKSSAHRLGFNSRMALVLRASPSSSVKCAGMLRTYVTW